MSLATAVSSATFAERLTMRGSRGVSVCTPFKWSQAMWSAIDDEPPLPQTNTVAPDL